MSEPARNNLTPEGMAPESLINLELAHKFDTVITESSRCRRTESMDRPECRDTTVNERLRNGHPRETSPRALP